MNPPDVETDRHTEDGRFELDIRENDHMAGLILGIGAIVALVIFDILALKYGADSRDRWRR